MHPPRLHPERSPLLADRLAATRRGRFVGRLTELETFRSALLATEPPFAVLHLHGPGGIGKTALLREFARAAAESGRPVAYLDGRNIDPSPSGFLFAVREALAQSVPGSSDATATVTDWPPAGVLLVDTYETLAPLDAWLRDAFLPQLPAGSLLVTAGRNTPALAWRADLDWAGLTHAIAVQNLLPEESRTYLAARGIPDSLHAEVLAFTYGHPLALALVADALSRGDRLAAFDPRDAPDVVRLLLERLIQDVPSAEHRRALEVCVLAWATTESLLAETLGVEDERAHNLFGWLRRQSFIEEGPHGLFPHDLAREALDADLQWRNPDGRRHLCQQLSNALYARLAQSSGRAQQRIWFDVLYLNRHNPFYGPYFDWSTLGSAYAEPAAPADHPAILAMVGKHQGEIAVDIARHWLRRQPDAFHAFRDLEDDLIGFMAHLAIHDATSRDVAVDPAVPIALGYVERHGPLRPGDEVVYHRFFMHRDAYQRPSPAVNLAAVAASIYWTTHPRLAWNFIAIAEPEHYDPLFASIHMWRVPAADFDVGDARYGVFAHDWRVEPVSAWLDVKADLASLTERDETRNGVAPSVPRSVLSETEFADAVRQALHDLTRPDRLAENPLLHSRLVLDVSDLDPAPETLQTLLRTAVATLTANPRDAKFHRALWHTFFEPAPTQEAAAELLGLPFNTYRYHLTKGIERITAWLWQRELDGPA